MVNEKAVSQLLILSLFYFQAYASDTLKIDSVLRLSNNELMAGDFVQAKNLAFQALQDSKESGFSYGVAWSSYRLANYFQSAGNYESASNYYNQSIELADILELKDLMASASTVYGRLLTDQKEYQKAEEKIRLALQISEDLSDSVQLGSCIEHLGTNYLAQGKLDEARVQYELSLEIATKIDDHVRRAICLQNLGQVYAELEDYALAEQYTRKALRIRLEQGDEHYVSACAVNLLYILNNQGKTEDMLRANTALFAALDSAGMHLSDAALEPQAYLMHEAQRKLESYKQRLWLLLGLIVLLLAGLAVQWRQARNTQRRLQAEMAELRLTMARTRESNSYSAALEQRIATLRQHKNPMLTPCYLCLGLGLTDNETADAIARNPSRVSRYKTDIAELLGIPRESVITDAVLHVSGRPVEEV